MKTNQSQKTTRWRRTVLALACVAAMGDFYGRCHC